MRLKGIIYEAFSVLPCDYIGASGDIGYLVFMWYCLVGGMVCFLRGGVWEGVKKGGFYDEIWAFCSKVSS